VPSGRAFDQPKEIVAPCESPDLGLFEDAFELTSRDHLGEVEEGTLSSDRRTSEELCLLEGA
jgi:hypothetical protein